MDSDWKSIWTYANSAEPVQMPQDAASEQSQHCLLTGMSGQKYNEKETKKKKVT